MTRVLQLDTAFRYNGTKLYHYNKYNVANNKSLLRIFAITVKEQSKLILSAMCSSEVIHSYTYYYAWAISASEAITKSIS